MNYFECEVKLNDRDETFVAKVSLIHLPRVGEHMDIRLSDDSIFRCIVKDIWHFCGGNNVGHRIIIYVNEVRKRDVTI